MTTPITAAMCVRGRSVTDPKLSPDGATVAFVAASAGRRALTLVPAGGGAERVLAADPGIAGAPGSYDWVPAGDAVVFVGADGAVWWQATDGLPPRALTAPVAAGSVAVSPDGTRVAYTVGQRDVAVAWLAGGGPWPVRLGGGQDFALDPAWSPDGTLVAWHEWDVPAMPWDDSRIRVAPAPAAGGPVRAGTDDSWVVAFPRPAACGQPRFSPAGGVLGFVCDAGGWANVWVCDEDGGGAVPLVADHHEHAGPTWGGGQRTWTWSPAGDTVALARNEEGFGTLRVLDPAAGRTVEVDRGVCTGLSWRPGALAAVRSGARTPDQVVVYRWPDPPPGSGGGAVPGRADRTTVARGPALGFERAGLVEPEVVAWDGEDVAGAGSVVHGRLWRSAVPSDDRPPPLIVWVHGGPTGQTQVTFNARLAYFTTRGWNVLHPDPRGSTGWGRPYTQALRGEWGRLDVDDVVAGVRAAVERGWGDPRRVAVMGGSSGGLVVLATLARCPELCAAGVDLYGVTDLFDLDETTHRYEAHYNVSLVGPLPDAAARYRDRSPTTFARRITSPLLVLHGTADPVVSVAQSEALVDVLRRTGTTVELHRYEGEGHGWSRPETLADELARVDAFLTRHVLRGRR